MNAFLDEIRATFHSKSVESSDLLELQAWPLVENSELSDSKETFVTCQSHLSNQVDCRCEICSSGHETAQYYAG